MELIRGVQSLSRTLKHPVVCIGNFDGVHLGHQQIVALTIEQARARGGTAVAYTFRPHPQVALRPEANIQLLTTYDEKIEVLTMLGVDVIIEEPFSREFSNTSPAEFFRDSLIRRLNTEAIVIGYDFAFGNRREGHLEGLKRLCAESGVALEVVSPHRVFEGGEVEVASSSRIRRYLLEGEIRAASRLLGREFAYRGIVVKGAGRGRKLGFPTANLQLENKLALPYGVYATWAVSGGTRYPSVTNVGVRPTFGPASGKGLPALVETHLMIERPVELYGSPLEVRFVERLREERRFDGVEELKAQIALDIDEAREALEK